MYFSLNPAPVISMHISTSFSPLSFLFVSLSIPFLSLPFFFQRYACTRRPRCIKIEKKKKEKTNFAVLWKEITKNPGGEYITAVGRA